MLGRPILVLLALGLALASLGDGAAARAIRADYSLRVRGFPVGTAKFRASITDKDYSIAFWGGISGIARLFTNIHTKVVVSGEIGNDRPYAKTYSHTWVEGHDTETVTMQFAGDGVTQIDLEPPLKRPERYVPITAEDKAQALDLVSAFLWPTTEGAVPQTCDRTLPLIDGRRRFNITFGFRRMDSIVMHRFRHTRTVVCSLHYHLLAGQRKGKKNDGFLSGSGDDAEVWLASAGGGLVVPVKVKLSTRIGGVVMQATKLETE